MQFALPDDPRALGQRYGRAVGQRFDSGTIRALAPAVEPLCVKDTVNRIRRGWGAMSRFPERSKALEISEAALRAWPMSGGERRRRVEKEQFRPATRLHYGAVPPAKRGAARDPAAERPGAHDRAVRVVQNAAISHQLTATGDRHEFAKRRHAILRHVVGVWLPKARNLCRSRQPRTMGIFIVERV